MLYSEFLTGTILIITGILVKLYPNLIAGYNTMSKVEKEKVDINGLSSMMRNYFVGLGLLVILLGIIFYFLNLKTNYSFLLSSTIIVITIIFMLIKAQKYHKK